MNASKHLCLGAALCALTGIASAAPLSVVELAASDVDCAFQPRCAVVEPHIFLDVIDVANATGIAQLRSQTFIGKPGTPAEGKTGYQYQVDMTRAVAKGDAACVIDLHVHFGDVTSLRYTAGTASDVFVVTKGGSGTIGLAAAEQNGDAITFTFEQPVCAAEATGLGQISALFGLTSAHPPQAITVKAGVAGLDHIDVRAMMPKR